MVLFVLFIKLGWSHFWASLQDLFLTCYPLFSHLFPCLMLSQGGHWTLASWLLVACHNTSPWRLERKWSITKDTADSLYCWWKKSCSTWDVKKPCKYWDKLPIKWCRISSINSNLDVTWSYSLDNLAWVECQGRYDSEADWKQYHLHECNDELLWEMSTMECLPQLIFWSSCLRIVDAFLSKFCHLRSVGFVGFRDQTQCLYAHWNCLWGQVLTCLEEMTLKKVRPDRTSQAVGVSARMLIQQVFFPVMTPCLAWARLNWNWVHSSLDFFFWTGSTCTADLLVVSVIFCYLLCICDLGNVFCLVNDSNWSSWGRFPPGRQAWRHNLFGRQD